MFPTWSDNGETVTFFRYSCGKSVEMSELHKIDWKNDR